MTVEITVGPPVLTINRSNTFMVTDHSGEITPGANLGVFSSDTRFVSVYRLWINGNRWQRMSAAAVSYHSARICLTNPEIPSTFESSEIPAGTVGLMLHRSVNGEIVEEFEVINYSMQHLYIVLELELMSDFADLFEVKAGHVTARENLETIWHEKLAELSTRYRNKDFSRHFLYRIAECQATSTYTNGRINFPIHLKPGESWRARGEMSFMQESSNEHSGARARRRRSQESRTPPGPGASHGSRLHLHWVNTTTQLSTTSTDLQQTYLQSVNDLGALRILQRDLGEDIWVPAAGVPWFVTLFGRDSIIASLQSLMVQARLAEGALRTLAKFQATEIDDWRDAQPGKIMHEVRHGELAHFNLIPQTPYYGTWDATPLYLILLHQAWLWLADKKLISDLRETAEGCLHWIDKYGDLDGDGFQEYKTFSSRGYDDMSWKDSGAAVVYPDGSQCKQPKALCELQGYVYAAKRGMAEVFAALGEKDRARELEAQAADLKRHFNERFWMPDEGTFAYGLDPEKKQIKTVVSNPGHCLWSGIVDDDKAESLIARLLQRDMWSGWGVRTLSSQNPAYNPFSYQRGSVWPHDNGILAAGMKRYGFGTEANRLASGIMSAAAHFQSRRLPEVFAGLERVPESFPVQYRGANTPQAWAAGSIFMFIQAMLGLQADAPRGVLWVDPVLPDWVQRMELRQLKVGQTTLHLRCWREETRSTFDVFEQQGSHIEVRSKQANGAEKRG